MRTMNDEWIVDDSIELFDDYDSSLFEDQGDLA